MSENTNIRVDFFNRAKKTLEKHRSKFANFNIKDFNLLTILRDEHDESNLHSRIIYELINPSAKHKYSYIFFEMFIDRILGNGENIIFTKNTNIIIEREYSIGNGIIDIFIKVNNTLLVIENKIYAGDQKLQLHRYSTWLNENSNDYKIIYLTLDGHLPSKKSLGDLDYSDVTCVSYKNTILNWLNDCVGKCDDFDGVKLMLEYYIKIIVNITGILRIDYDTNYKGYIMELSEMINNSEDFECVHSLLEAAEFARMKLAVQFWDTLFCVLKEGKREPRFCRYFQNKGEDLYFVEFSNELFPEFKNEPNKSDYGISFKMKTQPIDLNIELFIGYDDGVFIGAFSCENGKLFYGPICKKITNKMKEAIMAKSQGYYTNKNDCWLWWTGLIERLKFDETKGRIESVNSDMERINLVNEIINQLNTHEANFVKVLEGLKK